MSRLSPPRLNPLRVGVRTVAWAQALLRWRLSMGWDRLLRRSTPTRSAAQAMARIRALGPIASKVAQEFAYRLDVLPPALAFELSTLQDRMPEVPLPQVIALIEQAAGGPLHEHFEVFDPSPLGSRAIRCTYRGQLKDGRQVVVRVRRPGIRRRLGEEFAGLASLFRLAELLTVVRPGTFEYIRRETRQLLLDEADFRLESRLQTLYRQRVKRDRLRSVTVPRVVPEIVSEAVCTAEFVEGCTLAELIHAVESRDHARLQGLAEQGIHAEKVARRLTQLSWWEFNEHLFFHSDPGPMDIVVVPGGRLCLVHFADCTTTSAGNRRMLVELYSRLLQDDVSGATKVLVSLLEPLPFVDTHTFSKQVEERLWQELFALRDKEAPWWERTTAGLWAALLDVTREHHVPVHHDVIRIMRSAVMFGGMAARLHPDIEPLEEFRRYQRRADRRKLRRWGKDMQRRNKGDARPAVGAALIEVLTLTQRTLFYLRRVVEKLPMANLAMPRKAAYAASVLLQFTAVAVLGLTLASGATMARSVWLGLGAGTASQALLTTLSSPVTLALLGLLAVVGARRLLFRLSDIDEA